MISNSPYILVLDCDMYCNDPTSARQAMCFHLDPKISPSLGFVQFPQKFHNISKTDVYDSQLRYVFKLFLVPCSIPLLVPCSILDLEELVNKVRWLKGILGVLLPNARRPPWKFVEHHGSSASE
ncbi:hypothetical protein RHGRI_003559 [Rhododendron griersonianum]|uniref:Uncharacterized protein n=1 Tax=Rhododendron griersonianum TaxID=479676 RepID=A0AAV6L5H1_9ERIC|nr:hypothetical protein RHGRI_003559 [Rhododendron griersonianum]